MVGERGLTDLYSHFVGAGEEACASMGALSSPFYSLGGCPPDISFSPRNIGCERTVANFSLEEQCLPGMPWSTPDNLMPSRHFSAPLHRCFVRVLHKNHQAYRVDCACSERAAGCSGE